MDHPVCRGVIFIDNQQSVRHDKGEVIAEFVGLLLHNSSRTDSSGTQDRGLERGFLSATASASSSSSTPLRRRKCVLVDNTSEKCAKAAKSFARHPAAMGALELHTVHFTEADNLVDSPDASMQLGRILIRLRERGFVDVDLVLEDVLGNPAGDVEGSKEGTGSHEEGTGLPL